MSSSARRLSEPCEMSAGTRRGLRGNWAFPGRSCICRYGSTVSRTPGCEVLVGDVRGGNVKRVASAVGEESIATFVHQVLHRVDEGVNAGQTEKQTRIAAA